MPARRAESGKLVFLVAWLVIAATSCQNRGMMGTLIPNQRPLVRITEAPIAGSDPSSYVREISWTGSDPDGRVMGYRYAIDPPSLAGSDTAWIATADNRGVFTFRSDSVADGRGHRFHTFAVVAIDDHGAKSAPAHVSFDATTLAPTVVIVSPIPSALIVRGVGPTFRISWNGSDPDGLDSKLPAGYRWKVFTQSSVPSVDQIRANPDTISSLYAPSFVQWDSLPGDATTLVLRDLNPGQTYLFAIIAIDLAGAWSPVLSLYENLLLVRADPAATQGPLVTLYNSTFQFAFKAGGIQLEPALWPWIDYASEFPIVVQWTAAPTSGAFVRGARWAVDIESVVDESPRSDETTDIRHWSRWSTATSIQISGLVPPPGAPSESHRFYLEVEDDTGALSLVGMHLTVVRSTFSRDILIVDDTFFRRDRLAAGGCVLPPAFAWPTAAELDTFLFAVGGMPWKCYPAETVSPPGLFLGYDFDTIGTHTSPLSSFSLAMLGRFRNIVWMVDGQSALDNDLSFNSPLAPMPLFRHFAGPGVQHPLGLWLQQGGRLWLMGGGASYASLRDYDVPGGLQGVFSSSNGELAPGRFMYNFAHWRSEVQTYRSIQARRSARALGNWPGAPDYSQMPSALTQKSLATDPLPPLRSAGDFYGSTYFAEFLTMPNAILERAPETTGDPFYSTLDTLYETVGGASGTGRPVMTLYHGAEHGQVLFSGFPLWYFRRSQAIELTDFVLQRLWGLSRRPVPR